jgi:predicted nucleotidyltransferase component of viral defense system
VIPKAEVLTAAEESGLFPTTIEKDYVLGWVLFAVGMHPRLQEWVFKGGTCLKKCFFDTYRFSEDLDFTVPEDAVYGQSEIRDALVEVGQWIEKEAGIECPQDELLVEELRNKRGQLTYQARLKFVGPLRMPRSQLQRIKFDLTQDEILSDPFEARAVYHQYSDLPDPAPKVRCYAVDEVLAEKTRALYERLGRARDVYDVVNIGRNFRETVSAVRAREILHDKFRYKELPSPSSATILDRIDFDTLAADWENALGRQLAVLPPVQDFFAALRESLAWWIEEVRPAEVLVGIPGGADEEPVPRVRFARAPSLGVVGRGAAPPGWRSTAVGYSSVMDRIRFAARNRLLARIVFHGVERLVEPYSLRIPGTGNLLLYVFEIERGGLISGGIKAFKVAEITAAEPTSQPFTPRYAVEL